MKLSVAIDAKARFIKTHIVPRIVCVVSGYAKTSRVHQGISGLMPKTIDIATGLFVGPNLVLTTIPQQGLAEDPLNKGFLRRTFFIERKGVFFQYSKAQEVMHDSYRYNSYYGMRLMVVNNNGYSHVTQYWNGNFKEPIILGNWSGCILGLLSLQRPGDSLTPIVAQRVDDNRLILPPLKLTTEESRSSFIFTNDAKLVGMITGKLGEKMPTVIGVGGSVLQQMLFFNEDEQTDVRKIARTGRIVIK